MRAPAAGTVTIEKAVGASVVLDVMNQVSLPAINPIISAPSVNAGSSANSAAPGQPSLAPTQVNQAAAPGQNNLITVFSGGGTQVISDTTISVMVSPVVLADLGGQIGETLAGQSEGPVLIMAQFN